MLDYNHEFTVITGEYGVGKSTLGVTRYPPSKFFRGFIHDSEGSLNDVLRNIGAAGLQPGHYVDTRERFPDIKTGEILSRMADGSKMPWASSDQRHALVQYWEFVISDIADNLKEGKFDWVLFDTLEKLEAGMVAWVESNRDLSGYRTDNSGQKWWGAVYPLYETLLSAIWATGVKTVIFTTHLKNANEGGRTIVGKYRMSGKPLLYKLSTSMFWQVKDARNPRGEPAGLVLKSRYGDLGIDLKADTWNPKRLLPPRLPVCTWAEIERYITTECYDPLNPLPGEVLSPAEKSLIEPILSSKQLDLLIAEAQLEQAQIESQAMNMPGVRTVTSPIVKADLVPEIIEKIKQLRPENEDSTIREILTAEYKLPDVLRAFKECPKE